MKPSVICCGLSCIDMELHSCGYPTTAEAITTFDNATFTAGGSAPQTSRALAALSVPVAAIGMIGRDPHGKMLAELLQSDGVDSSHLVVDESVCTSLAVLPLFRDGTRGCFVTLAANNTATVDALLSRSDLCFSDALRVFHFGYPHLMPCVQGAQLRHMFERVRKAAPRVILTLDLNGVHCSEEQKQVLSAALPLTAAVHANLEEACTVTGYSSSQTSHTLCVSQIRELGEWFTKRRAAMVFITCGKDGVVVVTDAAERDEAWEKRLNLSRALERDVCLYRQAFAVAPNITVNASGAGDAFTAGFVAELANSAGERGLERITDAGLASALLRIDKTLSANGERYEISELVDEVRKKRKRLQARDSMAGDKYSTIN